jgi:CBS domain containing-hemolysin-like protein
MSKDYTTLNVSQITPEDSIAEYVYLPKIVHMDDSAVDCMLDFHKHQPLSFPSNTPLMEARQTMESQEQNVVLVLDESKHLVGVLSLEQALSRRVVSLIEGARVERKDVLLKSVMMPLADVVAVDMEQLKHAKVGHVVATLQSMHVYYIVVYEAQQNSNKKVIRGIFSTSLLNRYLGQRRITVDPAQTFTVAQMQSNLNKSS